MIFSGGHNRYRIANDGNVSCSLPVFFDDGANFCEWGQTKAGLCDRIADDREIRRPLMAIKIYNTLSRQKETFEPIEPGKVRFYVCGPTVYNYIHIGNARSAVAFDIIRRYFEYRGYQVNYVSNFTDIDDKIIKAAASEHLTAKDLSDKYIAAFQKDTSAIHIKVATTHPRVMENIPEIITYIEELIAKGFAYESQGDVYFSTRKFPDYGKLSKTSIDTLIQGASQRVNQAEISRKEDPTDFALWKSVANPDEIAWDSPWGPGRPGWHIECSVMSTKYLGDRLDIHGGGQDLEFPHHENEIAQSEAHSGHAFANYWMHNGFVTIGAQDEKMSKSFGNFVLLRDLLEAEDSMVVRYFLGMVHYRRPLRFDQVAMEEARSQVERLKEVFRRLKALRDSKTLVDETPAVYSWLEKVNEVETHFIEAMDDDFNAANGLTAIFNLVKTINLYLSEPSPALAVLDPMESKLRQLLAVFGLELSEETATLAEDIETLIEERNQARKAKQFKRADAIRDQLKERGIVLDDTPLGTTWKHLD